MSKTLYDHCVEKGDGTLLRQWDEEKNGTFTPQTITSGSKREIWWKCDKGHSWQVAVFWRTARGYGCPVCAGKRVIAGVNDLASAFPEISAEWHPTKNGAMTPETVAPYSNRRAWWRCSNGHEWEATIANRTDKKSGCPVCSRIKTRETMKSKLR